VTSSFAVFEAAIYG